MIECEKCNIIRMQRDGFLHEKIELEKKYHRDIAELRQRIEVVSQDRYTRDDELRYISIDLDSILFTLGKRPDDQAATYGGNCESLLAQIEYVRDIIQANLNFYSRQCKGGLAPLTTEG